jgi:hypothetical protein
MCKEIFMASDRTVQEVIDSMTEEQLAVMRALIALAIQQSNKK